MLKNYFLQNTKFLTLKFLKNWYHTKKIHCTFKQSFDLLLHIFFSYPNDLYFQFVNEYLTYTLIFVVLPSCGADP